MRFTDLPQSVAISILWKLKVNPDFVERDSVEVEVFDDGNAIVSWDGRHVVPASEIAPLLFVKHDQP